MLASPDTPSCDPARGAIPEVRVAGARAPGWFALEERRYTKMADRSGNTHTGRRHLELIERTPKVRAPGLRRGRVRERRVVSGNPLLI